jgi:Enoyl-CoA hydratase/isomerase
MAPQTRTRALLLRESTLMPILHFDSCVCASPSGSNACPDRQAILRLATMSDSAKPVLVHEEDGIMTLTLNRPAELNAINLAMSRALDAATARFGDSAELRVMVITGTGRYFSAGLDISEAGLAERMEFERPAPTKTLQRGKHRQRHAELHDELEKIEKPIIHPAQGRRPERRRQRRAARHLVPHCPCSWVS